MGVTTKTKPAAVPPRVLDEFDAMFPDLAIAIVPADGSSPRVSYVADPRASFARASSEYPENAGAKFVDPTRSAVSSCSLFLVVLIRDGREELAYADVNEGRAMRYAKGFNDSGPEHTRAAVRPVNLEGLGVVMLESKPNVVPKPHQPPADNAGLLRLAAMGSVPQK